MKEAKFSSNLALFIRKLLHRLREDRVTASGAQLAYFIVLSIFPFTIFLLNILSFTPYLKEDIIAPLVIILPVDLQRLILNLVSETVRSSSETLLSISALMGLWAASKGALAFIRIMNDAYRVKETRSYIYTRFLSIVFTLGLLLAFTLALLALVFGEFLASRVFFYIGFARSFISFWTYFRTLLALGLMIIIFTLIYKFAPALESEMTISFSQAFPGAVFSSLGWVITSLGFSYYVNNLGNFAKMYGSLAAVVILLFWLYMTSIIVIMGGEVNATIKCMKEEAGN